MFDEALLKNLDHVNQAECINSYWAQLYEDNLFLCAKYLLGYKDLSFRTHGPVCDVLTAPTKNKLVVLPRGAFKSSLCSVAWPIWLLKRNPDLRILIDSELYTNSKNWVREIRGHLANENFIKHWGNWRGKETWNEGEITISTRTRVLKEASITASGVGAEKTSQHYDLIVTDDLNTKKNSATKEGRLKVVDHYKYQISLLDPGSTKLIVGTRYSSDDVIGFVMENEIAERKGLL